MSRIPVSQEFTDNVFTRDRRAWWSSFNVPGVNICTNERLTVAEAFDAHLPWEIQKVSLIDGENFNESGYFGLKRDDTGVILGVGTDRYTVVSNRDQADLLTAALDGTDYAVASIGALLRGAVTFVSVDFPDVPGINAAGQQIETFLSVVNANDGSGSLKVVATGIRPECLNTIDAGWLAGVRFAALKHTTNISDRLVDVRRDLRQYLGLAEQAEATIEKLINTPITAFDYRRALERLTPIPDPKVKEGKVVNAREITLAEKRRDQIIDLAYDDERVGFAGTLWGAFQTFSTFDQHYRGFRRTERSGVTERGQVTLDRHLSGVQTVSDADRLSALVKVLDLGSTVKVTPSLVAVS
jgi:phage/plasmid-like protein (TIGR03299 family)